MTSLMEEGELPEEGEITEDEEEQNSPLAASSIISDHENKQSEKKEFNILPSKKNISLMSTEVTIASSKTPKYKDYDGKSMHHGEITQNVMANSWMGSLQRRSRGTLSPTSINSSSSEIRRPVAAESESMSKISACPSKLSDVSGKSKSVAVESMDRDFRRLSSTGHHIFGDEEADEIQLFNENNEDNDFRQVNTLSHEQKRRNSTAYTNDYVPHTKKAKSSATSEYFEAPSDGETSDIINTSTFDENNSSSFRRRNNSSNRVPPSHWASRTICKFFREGYCRDGENCAFSHCAADSNRRTELCKFYSQGFCKRGMNCTHLHGEFPCKAFHKGECTNDPCSFSHRPLDDFTRPIYEQAIQDEELTSNISLPSQPQKRKVLLPQGPENADSNEQSEGSPTLCEKIVNSSTTVSTSVRPSCVTHQQMKQRAAEDKAMAATGTFGFFNPITPTSKPNATHTTSLLPPPISLMTPISGSSLESKPSTPALGAFCTSSSSANGVRSRASLQTPVHGFYNVQGRVANMPPPALLTMPPLLSSSSNTLTVQSSISTIAQSVSSTSFFNPPMVTSSSLSTPSSQATGYGSTIPSVVNPTSQTTASSAFSIAPLPLSTPIEILSSSKADDLEEKPLSRMFSGGFFENSSSQNLQNTTAVTTIDNNMSMSGGNGGGFNISAMLEKITQQATATPTTMTVLPSLNSLIASRTATEMNNWTDESPASPTNTFSETGAGLSVKMIPVIREWKLYKVALDKDDDEEINVDLKWIGQISSGSYKNDPRLKKLAEKQFDLVTKTLEKQSNLGKLPLKPESSTSNNSSGNTSPSKKNAALADPRIKPIDPRKRIASSAAKPICGELLNANCSLKNAPATDEGRLRPACANILQPFGAYESVPITASLDQKSTLPDDIFQSMIQQQLKLVNQMQQQQQAKSDVSDDDVDHRAQLAGLLCPPLSSFMAFPPPSLGKAHFPCTSESFLKMGPDACPSIANTIGNTAFREKQEGYNDGYNQRFNRGDNVRNNGRREFQQKFHHKGKGNDNPNGHKWNQQDQNKNFPKRSINSSENVSSTTIAQIENRNVAVAATTAEITQPTALPQQSISLREKRKNNEYESPLARVPSSRY